jgi:hypothetical protein
MPAANAPSRVPFDGLFCAIEVPSGTAILASGSYKTPDGTIRSFIPGVECPGKLVGIAPNIHGWIMSSNYTWSSGSYNSIASSWSVPAAPQTQSTDPTNFLWNGLISASGQFILQPVLGWGCLRNPNLPPGPDNCATDTGNFWWLASVVDDTSTSTFIYSTPIKNIPQGHTIRGETTWTEPLSQCASTTNKGFTIVSTDNGVPTTLYSCESTNNYPKGFVGVFEAKKCSVNPPDCKNNPPAGITACSELAGNSNPTQVIFSSVTTNPTVPYPPGFYSKIEPNLSPPCTFVMNPPNGQSGQAPITLQWNPLP